MDNDSTCCCCCSYSCSLKHSTVYIVFFFFSLPFRLLSGLDMGLRSAKRRDEIERKKNDRIRTEWWCWMAPVAHDPVGGTCSARSSGSRGSVSDIEYCRCYHHPALADCPPSPPPSTSAQQRSTTPTESLWKTT